MMMKRKRLLAALLALMMVLMLGACGGDDAVANSEKQDPSAVDSPSPSPSAGEDEAAEQLSDEELIAFYQEKLVGYTQQIAGLDPDEVVMTINGEEITAELYLYWLTYDCMYWDYMSRYMYGSELDFGAESSYGLPYRDYLLEDATQLLINYVVLRQHAAEEGCLELTAEQQAEWDAQKAEYIAESGEVGYAYLLAQSGMSEELFTSIQTVNCVYDNVGAALNGDPSEEEMQAFIEVKDKLRAKHILLCTGKDGEDGKVLVGRNEDEATNEDGTPFTGTADEYNAMVKEKIDGILAQLRAADDPIALFDELMHEHSEDPGLASYPDGYDFTANEMVAEFEQGTRDLEYNEISDVIQTSDGYHIILRLKPDVLEDYMTETMNLYLNNWMYNAEVETMESFDSLDAEVVYENYVAYQEELLAVRNG